MDDQIIAVFCLCDDLLKAMRHQEDPQRQMSDAEVMTTALVASLEYSGNFEKACRSLSAPHHVPGMLGASRFNRRLHRIKPVFLIFFHVLAEVWKDLSPLEMSRRWSSSTLTFHPVRRSTPTRSSWSARSPGLAGQGSQPAPAHRRSQEPAESVRQGRPGQGPARGDCPRPGALAHPRARSPGGIGLSFFSRAGAPVTHSALAAGSSSRRSGK